MQNLPCPHRLQTLLLWSLILCVLPAVVLSQINTAELQGVITDPANASVGAATVRVENRETGLARETKTRENGDYLFLALPPGHYKVSVDAAGFRPAVVEDVVLTIGQQAQLSFKLEISTVVEALVISADAAVVETTRTSVATTVDQRAIENLATNGRSYINFTLLDSATTRDNQPVLGPAPTSGLNIGGQRARANMVSIDGADAIDNTINGVRATLSQEAVRSSRSSRAATRRNMGGLRPQRSTLCPSRGPTNGRVTCLGICGAATDQPRTPSRENPIPATPGPRLD